MLHPKLLCLPKFQNIRLVSLPFNVVFVSCLFTFYCFQFDHLNQRQAIMFILLHKSRCELCLETQYVIAYLADFIRCCLNGYYAAKTEKEASSVQGPGIPNSTNTIAEKLDCWQPVFLSIFSLKENGTRHCRGTHEKKNRLQPLLLFLKTFTLVKII